MHRTAPEFVEPRELLRLGRRMCGWIPNAHPAPRTLRGGMSLTCDTGELQKLPGQLWCVHVLGESICLPLPHLWQGKREILPKGWREGHLR